MYPFLYFYTAVYMVNVNVHVAANFTKDARLLAYSSNTLNSQSP
jgi:hypothetical protein